MENLKPTATFARGGHRNVKPVAHATAMGAANESVGGDSSCGAFADG